MNVSFLYINYVKSKIKLLSLFTILSFSITIFYSLYLNINIAYAQIQGQNGTNFGTFGTYNYSNEVYGGLNSITSTLTNSGSYNTTYSYTSPANYDPTKIKFGTTNANVEILNSTSGFSGFIRNLFTPTQSSNTNYVVNPYTISYNNPYTSYSNFNAYNAYNMYNPNVITTIKPGQFGYPQPGSPNYNNYFGNSNNYYYNIPTTMGQTAYKLGGGALGKFFGGIIDTASYVGGKIVYGGEKILTGLTNIEGHINAGISASTTGLVGTIGKVLGFGARLIIGATKVAITIPVLATKAFVYLTALTCAGCVKILGGGLNALKIITNTHYNNLQQLNFSITQIARDALNSLGNQNTNYYIANSNYPQNFNYQQFGTQVNNIYAYTNQVQQNMISNQQVVNSIQLTANQTMNNLKLNTKIAGITLLEVMTKLAYNVSSFVSSSASNVSLALARSIQNLETTKNNLKLLKELNKQGIINPYLYQQYLNQAQQGIYNSQILFGNANQNINNAYLSTLSNINQTNNYILSNSQYITNQMNQYSNSLYTQNFPYNVLNQYNNNLNYLNNSYSQLNGTFGYAQLSNYQNPVTTQTSISNFFNFNEGSQAERVPTTQVNLLSLPSNQTPEIKQAYEKYLAAYNNYIQILAKSSESENSNSDNVNLALEEYKKAYLEYESLLNKVNASQK